MARSRWCQAVSTTEVLLFAATETNAQTFTVAVVHSEFELDFPPQLLNGR